MRKMSLYFEGNKKLLKASMTIAEASGASVYIETMESNTVAGEADILGFYYQYGPNKGFTKIQRVKCLKVMKDKFIGEIYNEEYTVFLPKNFNIIISTE